MERLLDFSSSQEFDVSLLDGVVRSMYAGSGGKEQQLAQQVLSQFQEHPDAWSRVPAILEKSSSSQTKFIALQILEKLINTRWKTLPSSQKQGPTASDEATLRREKTYMNKLNLALIQILKQEWPQDWPTFIPELIESSHTNISLCENNMAILKLLSEEVFDYSSDKMTQGKANALKIQLHDEFAGIFLLCTQILTEATKTSLIKITLETVLRFLNWIPLNYVFETNIIDLLLERFLEMADFRNITMKCLAEVAALDVGSEHDPKFVILYNRVVTAVSRLIPISTDIAAAYDQAAHDGQEFILCVALFISNFLQKHLFAVETEASREALIAGHAYLVKISRVDEREIFKICVEYWLKLLASLYEDMHNLPAAGSASFAQPPLSGPGTQSTMHNGSVRLKIYAEVLSELRLVVIAKMAKPEEVLVVENDEGEMVREFVQESDTIALYKSMRQLLVYLTHLDVKETETVLSEKLSKQIDGSEWSWNNVNTLCWAIGSISGAMVPSVEQGFFVHVVKNLLALAELRRGKDDKVVVASNIMYIVGQYPRFLKNHWRFTRTVVHKLFEFMHEKHEGVQDMACDTFMTIAQKCRRQFVDRQPEEREPFIIEILQLLPNATLDLSPLQVHTFYEAVGYMISAETRVDRSELLIQQLMSLPTQAWTALLSQSSADPELLKKPETMHILINILRSYVAACSSIGAGFVSQLGVIYQDMMELYNVLGLMIVETMQQEGEIAAKTPKLRYARTAKKETLRLVGTFLKAPGTSSDFVEAWLAPLLLETVLRDYQRSSPDVRDPEVLRALTTLISLHGTRVTSQVPAILDGVFEPTLSMIKQDFVEFPEHRIAFFKLLQAIVEHSFSALQKLSEMDFKQFMNSVGWAVKHTQRDVAEVGLDICNRLLSNYATAELPISKAFYERYYLVLLQDAFFVLTDADHKSGFKAQTALLARIIELVQNNQLNGAVLKPDPSVADDAFVREYIVGIFVTAFPHASRAYLNIFVSDLFLNYRDPAAFKLTLRDFLIQLKEFSGDNTDLFLEEKEAELLQKAKADREAALRIPGMLKPSQLEDDDDD
ncbi:hypothetical protein BV25DRAFT_1917398 [Artomyces pyxidatus]|uniref:Uncharacterized protein n=1 Tax=Artomyces pyxidatus TaxID=48021 RepID=A0ACB8SX68_9AGAM|nr:hypothetical protein BV25DRAFT_1917398 [Artomyces pyxidatus]